MRINYLLQRRPRRRLYISPGPKILTLRGQVPFPTPFLLFLRSRCASFLLHRSPPMSTKSLPKGLRRFLRHYSASTLVVVPLHAGTVYNEVLTVLRSCPSLSPLSTIEPNAQLSDWVFRVDSCVAVWRTLFISVEARRRSVGFFLYDLVASDFERIKIWRSLSVTKPFDALDTIFPDVADPLPPRRDGGEDSPGTSGDSGESDSVLSRAAGKRPQPSSPPPAPLAPTFFPPSKRSRIEPPPIVPPVIDPVLMGPSAGGSGPAPVVGGGDPNRVHTFSPLFPASLVFDLLSLLL